MVILLPLDRFRLFSKTIATFGVVTFEHQTLWMAKVHPNRWPPSLVADCRKPCPWNTGFCDNDRFVGWKQRPQLSGRMLCSYIKNNNSSNKSNRRKEIPVGRSIHGPWSFLMDQSVNQSAGKCVDVLLWLSAFASSS